MYKIIHKQFLNPLGSTKLDIRVGSRLLSAGTDLNGELCVWYESKLEEPKLEERTFLAIWTGREFPESGVFIATVKVNGLIVHVFEREVRE